MLALIPGADAPGAGASTDTTNTSSHDDALAVLRAGFGDGITEIDTHGFDPHTEMLVGDTEQGKRPFHPVHVQNNTAFTRGTHPDYDRWIEHGKHVGGCTQPILLRGESHVVDKASGQIISTRSTTDMPDAAIYKACGNRRASACPACAEVYRRDTYQLVLAGLNGGKGVPDGVRVHPSAFPTFTAPSFGLVHSRRAKNNKARVCRPGRKPRLCPHGIDLRCFQTHHEGERRLGKPLCLDCYDHDHQVVWNVMSAELWRRTMETAKKHLRTWARHHATNVRVSFAKVAEMQARGVVHFHALMRLDGVDPFDPTEVIPPPNHADFTVIDAAIRYAVATTKFRTPAHPDNPEGWLIEWGVQLDIRPVRLSVEGEITETQVAGYLAKYSTKATEMAGHNSKRITPDAIEDMTKIDGHVTRLLQACWRLGRPGTDPAKKKKVKKGTRLLDPENMKKNYDRVSYRRLRRWAHMLGFGGHFSTKSRAYSTTLRALREARLTWRREHHRTAEHTDDVETTLIVGNFTYAATGWRTLGDEMLAASAAARAREHRRVAREEFEALYLAPDPTRKEQHP
ncbi:MAG TPA: replication initiator [Jiangellaceae bacterium]